jgi:arylsulfatase A-like enzyme
VRVLCDHGHESLAKIPFIASHPVPIPWNWMETAMFSAYDVMPALLDYLDLPVPEDRNLPGQSFLPLVADRRRSTGEPTT